MIAVKFTHPGGRVEILASSEGQEAVLIQVCDTGQECLIGIMRWLEQIFPPYRQQA
jgi:signal transduction histidine kinase